ncbi:dynein-associated protein, putative [Plasmodium gallinaceum]|uniref:Dynein-associated protein, putative n=1 Tax=Plasmodium gallinaceum TaxID=5849 RepID=A0A1J1GTA5_PLAGA|nr:dynein-associated protein, putative [Plasmodium gallinaceum]CRG95722.1 dynein-associated protein, putative [Plasmodium gallinaceum]
MRDYLVKYNKYLKYDISLIIENEDEKNKNLKDEKNMKDKNIVRVIEEIRKNLKSNILYKNDNKNVFFNDPIYQFFPSKCTKEKNVESISYVSRVANEEDTLICLRKIYEVIANMYAENFVIKKEFLDDLLNIFMELCRQVSVMCFQRGFLLKKLFNYNVMLLNQYHKLVKSSLVFNIKKQIKQNEILSNLNNEIEIKRNAINSLKIKIINTEEMIENETINAEKELSEVNMIYQNKIDKLKKNNQRNKDEFTRILQL